MTTLTMAVRPTTIDNAGTTQSNGARSTGAARSPSSSRSTSPALVAVRDGLWRVVDRSGAILGHIERETQADGDRYLARRLVMATRRIELGAFWRIDDAIDCFR